MNFCGIICEFNPFHNGHEYLINEAKKITNCDILCLMSGDFVQRGTPAIENKYQRAKKAILAGATAVLELPTIYATSNAEIFASGAIKIFKSLNIKQIAFGIENTSLEILKKIAQLKFENSEKFKLAFKNEIENGINYNTALKRSISKCIDNKDVTEILNKPNNILAIEYLTAILKQNADIKTIAINRSDNGYNSYLNKTKYLSATAIRELIINNKSYSEFIPNYAKIEDYFSNENNMQFENLILYKLRNTDTKKLSSYYDYNEGIEYRIKKYSDECTNLESLTNKISTPRYRISRVNKLILYPLLEITKKSQSLAQKTKPVVKVLAIRKNNKILLSTYNKKSR